MYYALFQCFILYCKPHSRHSVPHADQLGCLAASYGGQVGSVSGSTQRGLQISLGFFQELLAVDRRKNSIH